MSNQFSEKSDRNITKFAIVLLKLKKELIVLKK